MTFPAGELVASIRMDGLEQFERDNARAQSSFQETGRSGSAVGGAIRTAMGIAVAGTTALTLAAGGYLTSLFQTGAAYNTLQQTSRAALTTLLGGTQAAADQMAKLDDFARNSPFSKAVFISAQQQLIGFGVAAKDVIPILGAVQDAVAATGGSSNQIASVVEVLAKIKSQGKITGEELMQLGGRGIDAAGLIGKSLGKSGAEIKQSITKGTLDADTALDALAKGMTATYGGAAAEVKKTWSGAVDRIKAANREIGAAIAEPFISQQGGGLAIIWGNQVADVLRAILSHAQPVMAIFSERLTPTFAAITSLLDKARVVIKSWDSSKVESFLSKAEAHAPAIAALAGAFLGLNAQLLAGIPLVGSIARVFNPVGAAIAALVLSSPKARDALKGLFGAFEPLVDVGKQVAVVFSGMLTAALPVVVSLIDALTTVVTPLVGMLAQIPAPVLAGVAAFFALDQAAGPLVPVMASLMDVGKDLPLFFRNLREMSQVQAALGAMEGNTSRFAGALGVAGKAATGLGQGLRAVFVANAPALIIMGVVAAVSALVSVLGAQAQKVTEARERMLTMRDAYLQTSSAARETVKAQTEAFLGQREAAKFAAELGVSMDTVTKAAMGNRDAYNEVADAAEKWQAGIVNDVAGNARRVFEGTRYAADDLLSILDENNAAMRDGKGAAAEYKEELRRAAKAMTDTERSNQRMNAALEIARDVSKDATERLSALKQALDELNGGTKSAAELEKSLNDQARDLADAFAVVDDNGTKLASGLVDASGKIDTTTAAGSRLFDEVKGLNDQMLDAILAADASAKAQGRHGASMEEASAAAQPYIDKLKTIASEAGLSDGQVDGLIQTMLDTPSMVAFMLTDDGTIDAEKLRLIDLATQIRDTPDKEFEVSSDDFPGLQEALRSLGTNIKDLPAGQVKVKTDKGSFDAAEYALNNLARTRFAGITVATIKGNPSLGYPGNAGGGRIVGPGTGTSDTAGLFRLSNDEHVVTAREVKGAGGHAEVERVRAAWAQGRRFPGLAEGGQVVVPRVQRFDDTSVAMGGATVAVAAPATAPISDEAIDRLVERLAQTLAAHPRLQVTNINPVARDGTQQAWEQAQEEGLL